MWRTVKQGHRHVQPWDWVIVGGLTILAPVLIGLFAGLLVWALETFNRPPRALGPVLGFLMAQSIAPIVSIFAVPLGLVLGARALRIGWAGWGVAILVPVAVIGAGMYVYAQGNTGYAPSVYKEPARIFMVSGAIHGAIMWCALRWRRPEAIAPRLS